MVATSWSHDTERYRYASQEDLRDITEMLSDPEVGRWLWFTPLRAEAIADYFEPLLSAQARAIEAGEPPETAVFAVFDLRPGRGEEFLGQGAAVATPGSPDGFEIGFQFRRQAWGRGVGMRLGRFLCAYAVHVRKAYRIEASCLKGNAGSRRILERLGLHHEGTLCGYRLKEGRRHDELRFGALVEELDGGAIDRVARAVGLLGEHPG